mmetsp:Transcript_18957/g.46548  ORF Transcript_18957/g.46548 Transcript_18957/m.46548 type:complete len:115 (-) Transcript_18957:112-456(-)
MAGAFDGSSAMQIKKLLSAELHRWVSTYLDQVCKLPTKATVHVLQYHCPDFGDELERETATRRLKDAENDHKTDDKNDATQDAQRRMHEQQLRREFGSQRRMIRYRQNNNDDYW